MAKAADKPKYFKRPKSLLFFGIILFIAGLVQLFFFRPSVPKNPGEPEFQYTLNSKDWQRFDLPQGQIFNVVGQADREIWVKLCSGKETYILYGETLYQTTTDGKRGKKAPPFQTYCMYLRAKNENEVVGVNTFTEPIK